MNLNQGSSTFKWFMLSIAFCALFIIYTVIYATHALDLSTLYVERWLLNRPIGQVDCVFYEWRNLGEVQFSLPLTVLLGLIAWRAGFRPRVLLILLLILGVCIGCEVLGKKLFHLELYPNLRSGEVGLSCPQLLGKPLGAQLAAAVGLQIPPPPTQMVDWTHTVAKMPIVFHPSFQDTENSYPGGHAMRWSFLGLIACWLCWRRIKGRLWRAVFSVFFFLLAFLGGFMQFYIGVHFLTDTISGYLFGISAACCAIGFLTLNDLRRAGGIESHRRPVPTEPVVDVSSHPTLPQRSVTGTPQGF